MNKVLGLSFLLFFVAMVVASSLHESKKMGKIKKTEINLAETQAKMSQLEERVKKLEEKQDKAKESKEVVPEGSPITIEKCDINPADVGCVLDMVEL